MRQRVLWVVEVQDQDTTKAGGWSEWAPRNYLLPYRVDAYDSRRVARVVAHDCRYRYPGVRYRVSRYTRKV